MSKKLEHVRTTLERKSLVANTRMKPPTVVLDLLLHPSFRNLRPGKSWLGQPLLLLVLLIVLLAGAASSEAVLANSQDSTIPPSYITVEVTQVVVGTPGDETVFTDFAVTWSDPEVCSSSYNAYLNILPGNRPGHETPGSQSHLGSATSDSTQLRNRLADVQGQIEGFNVEAYCGTDESGRLISRVLIPSSFGQPKIGTYSSEPPLTALGVSHGTIGLTPNPVSDLDHYTVPDVANADTRITITATLKAGYAVEFYESSDLPPLGFMGIIPGPGGRLPSGRSDECEPNYGDHLGTLPDLTDADPDTPGFQMDLYDGDNFIFIRVYPTTVCEIGVGHHLTITRAEGPVTLVRPNRPAEGGVGITNKHARDAGYWQNRGPYVGMALSAYTKNLYDRDGLTNPNFSYQWLADDVEISGASGATYRATSSDLGKTLKLRVSFTDDRGDEEIKTSDATEVVRRKNSSPVGKPIIRGIAEVGQTLRADTSGISDPNGLTNATYTYEWYGGWGNRPDSNEYTLVESDAGYTLYLVVTYTDDDGHEERLWSEPLGEVTSLNNAPTGVPVIRGTPQVGETLTADTSGITDPDGFDGSSFQYQWFAYDGTVNSGTFDMAASTYTPVASDVGKTLTVRVIFTDDNGNEEWLTSGPTAAVVATVPGVPSSVEVERGDTGELDVAWEAPVSNGGSDVTGYTVQWKEATDSWDTPADVSEATTTDTSYTISSLSLGTEYTVRVMATNSAGDGPASAEVTEMAEAQTSQQQVATQNTPATGAPTISGTLQVGETLTADTSGIEDADGLNNVAFSYQWLRSVRTTHTLGSGNAVVVVTDTTISGATDSTYTQVSRDVGETIKVRVTFTDDADYEETLTSAATGAVASVPTPLTASTHDAPDRHDGENSFTFELRFSEEFDLSYAKLRDHAFTVTEGTVAKARRLAPPGNVRWEITVEPSSDADVSIVLPATTDCADQAAICTEDGRMLSVELSLTVAGPVEEEDQTPPENNPATGVPTISGTAQVGETLTAGTSGISDNDGLNNATFSYRWLADEADIPGATGASYILTEADEGKAIKVRVSFTDDGGNDESLTSAATEAVVAAPTPLTASTHQVPPSHDGQNAFTFELLFSEEFELSYMTLRDHAFTVTGGTVTKARRLNRPSNIRWEITVEPNSSAAVTVALPVTTDCEAQGAICTEDGKKLSAEVTLNVRGPGG